MSSTTSLAIVDRGHKKQMEGKVETPEALYVTVLTKIVIGVICVIVISF